MDGTATRLRHDAAAELESAGSIPVDGIITEPELSRLRSQVRRLSLTVEQLEHALDSRVVVEQAKGIVAERFAITIDEAFTLLRDSARAARMDLHALCGDVVANGRGTPGPIRARLGRHLPARGDTAASFTA